MGKLLAAAGRFDVHWLISTALSGSNLTAKKSVPATIWGLSYCYGNQLGVLRVNRPRDAEKELARLTEIKTDMVIFYLHDNNEVLSPRLVQPFVHRGVDSNWAFCHISAVRGPELLSDTNRSAEGGGSGEYFFRHLLDHFNPNQPIESVQTILSQISGEPDLSFAMMSPEMLVVTHWKIESEVTRSKLFLGKCELLRIFTNFPPMEIPGVEWNEVVNHLVTVILRSHPAVV
ncbi:MAG: hypothetical protein ACUVUD_02735 [bacterium]